MVSHFIVCIFSMWKSCY